MISSMTGFALGSVKTENYDISVELKSVNHRYLELNIRASRGYPHLEAKMRTLLKQKISRGKVDAYITVKNNLNGVVNVDTVVAQNYVNALNILAQQTKLKNDLTISALMRIKEIFDTAPPEEDTEETSSLLEQTAEAAIAELIFMRTAEGEKLKLDILEKLNSLRLLTGQIELLYKGSLERYREKLAKKIQETLSDTAIDENRILTEAAIYAEKSAIDEELVRLHSHIAQFFKLLDTRGTGGTVGKTLDFLCQEINREVNTISSKSSDTQIVKLVIDAKSGLEKIREQVQNIE
ncbi:MAG: YicC family protein [Oscillospiraceae bacterium]|nr:YicC family protein [Oscillospiraceae bacterium]